jgi:hypothetical protein
MIAMQLTNSLQTEHDDCLVLENIICISAATFNESFLTASFSEKKHKPSESGCEWMEIQ